MMDVEVMENARSWPSESWGCTLGSPDVVVTGRSFPPTLRHSGAWDLASIRQALNSRMNTRPRTRQNYGSS